MAALDFNFGSLPTGTKISDIKVDPRLRCRIDTGIEWLNFVKSGDGDLQGLMPGEVILLTGDPGGGKSTLSLQLADSLAARGHSVLYNDVEQAPGQTKLCYERLGCSSDFVIQNAKFTHEPEGGNKELRDMVGDNVLNKHLEDFVKTHKRKHKDDTRKSWADRKHMIVIVDSLNGMNDGKYGVASNNKTPLRVAQWLCNAAKENYITIILIGHVTKGGAFKGDNTLSHMIDAHLHIAVDQDPKSDTEGCRLFGAEKNRFGPTGITVVLDIGKDGLREHGRRGGTPRGIRV